TQVWDTPVTTPPANGNLRSNVVRRGAKLYPPDFFLALKRKKWRFDAEVAMTYGSVNTHQPLDFDPATVDPQLAAQLMQPINFLQFGGALQTDIALLAADALLVGLEFGGASGDKGAYGFGARPRRSGSGAVPPTPRGGTPVRAARPGRIAGPHPAHSNPRATP